MSTSGLFEPSASDPAGSRIQKFHGIAADGSIPQQQARDERDRASERADEIWADRRAMTNEFRVLSADSLAEQERRAKMTQAQRDAEDRRRERQARKQERDWQKFVESNRPDMTAWAVGTSRADKVRLRLDDEVKNNDKFLNA